jgi:hypothetical protein
MLGGIKLPSVGLQFVQGRAQQMLGGIKLFLRAGRKTRETRIRWAVDDLKNRGVIKTA